MLELLKALSKRGHKFVGQGHQPVDQAQEFPDFVVGVAGVERADRQSQTQVVEAIWLPTVALSGEMGGDEEPGPVVPMAGQVGVALHLIFKMDEQPLLAAIEPADLDERVGAQRTSDGIGDEGVGLLLERGGVDSPVDERSDRGKGELQEGPKELVEGLLPGAVVVDGIEHPT